MTEFVASPERLIIGALLGFAVLLFLIIKLKIQPFIAIMSSALIIGLVSGMPFSMITDTLAEGVGNTLQTIAECGVRGLEGIKAFTVTAGDLTIRIAVANGLAKAKAVKAVVSGPVTPECPGSILQMHPDCILVADEEALSLL